MISRMVQPLRRLEAPSRRVVWRLRRLRVLTRARVSAAWYGVELRLDVARDLRVGKGVRITIVPGFAQASLTIGRKSRFDESVEVVLAGGEAIFGERVEIRRGVLAKVAGKLELKDEIAVSWHSVIHCSNSVVLESKTGIAERVTISDSSHYFTEPDVMFWHNVQVGAVTVGRNTWVCPGAVLTRHAQVGAHCIVAANSVVTGPVPNGHLASGVPAVTRSLRHSWYEVPG